MAKPTAVGCSIYAGLFTLGVKCAGFRVLAHLEQDRYGTDTAKLNHPELEIYFPKEAWPEKLDADLVFCNPPCAVWSGVGGSSISTSAVAKRWQDDPRLQHAYDALELVDRYRPKVWVWESVPNALTKGRTMILEMVAYGRERGYAATVLHFNAATLGVPQQRTRVFVVLHRVAFEPGPTDHDRVVTVREAWKGLPKTNTDRLRNKSTEHAAENLLPHVPQGAALRRVFDSIHGDEAERNVRGHVIGRTSISDRRLKLNGLGHPILSRCWHPTQHRRITVGEAMRLCQLPDEWRFAPSTMVPDERLRLLQRAVMPAVGEWVARAAARAIRRGVVVQVDRTTPAIVYDLRAREPNLYPLLGDETMKTSKAESKAPDRAPGASTARTAPATASKRPRAPKPRRVIKPARPARGPVRPVTKAVVEAKELAVNKTAKTPKPAPVPPAPTRTKTSGSRADFGPTVKQTPQDAVDQAARICASTVGSGALIRRLILRGKHDDDQIVAAVLKEFENRRTTRADVSWNRGMLRRAGLLR